MPQVKLGGARAKAPDAHETRGGRNLVPLLSSRYVLIQPTFPICLFLAASPRKQPNAQFVGSPWTRLRAKGTWQKQRRAGNNSQDTRPLQATSQGHGPHSPPSIHETQATPLARSSSLVPSRNNLKPHLRSMFDCIKGIAFMVARRDPGPTSNTSVLKISHREVPKLRDQGQAKTAKIDEMFGAPRLGLAARRDGMRGARG